VSSRWGFGACVDVRLHRDDAVSSTPDDRTMRHQPGPSIDEMIDFVIAGLSRVLTMAGK